jgi:hypothetical protein
VFSGTKKFRFSVLCLGGELVIDWFACALPSGGLAVPAPGWSARVPLRDTSVFTGQGRGGHTSLLSRLLFVKVDSP